MENARAETPSHAPQAASQAAQPARSIGQNLFNAKSPLPPPARALPNRNLLLALGGTILLLGIGGGWLWYLDSTAGSTTPLRPAVPPPAATQVQAPANLPPAPAQQDRLVPGINEGTAVTTATGTQHPPPDGSAPAAVAMAPANPPPSPPIHIEQQKTELLDPLLRNAYLAYRSGNMDDARQLYLAMYRKDAHNIDALLGLATIALQRGEDPLAAQYYAQVLAIDPRNAPANAGMSSLSSDSKNNESRLKLLLREQGNSAALHFALGNLYAGQSRWGEAQQAYFNAWTLDSSNAEYAFNLAVSLDHLGQGALAAQHYQRAIQLDPFQTAGFDHAQISRRAQELAH